MANILNNIFDHPKTSVAGLLVGTVTVAGVLSQQGVTLGKAGTGTIVALIAGVASALLGLLAKDPGEAVSPAAPAGRNNPPMSTAKLGAWMLISVLLMGSMVGCTQAQIQQTEAVVNVVVEAASNVIAIGDPGAAWALDLPGAIAGLKTAEANYQAGTGAAVVVSNALLTVEDVIAGVAPGSKASELADILTTAIDAALLVFPPSPTASSSVAAAHGISSRVLAEGVLRYNHHGRPDGKIHHMMFRSPADDIWATWNGAVKKNPQLAAALLK